MSAPHLDARTAAAITAGMLAVALSDGQAHPRELALIHAFRADLPDDVDPSGVVIADPVLREILVRSLVSVALSDGAMKTCEREVILEIARAHGASSALVQEIEVQTRREMLGHFRGTVRCRAQVERIGEELGMTTEEVRLALDAAPLEPAGDGG